MFQTTSVFCIQELHDLTVYKCQRRSQQWSSGCAAQYSNYTVKTKYKLVENARVQIVDFLLSLTLARNKF